MSLFRRSKLSEWTATTTTIEKWQFSLTHLSSVLGIQKPVNRRVKQMSGF